MADANTVPGDSTPPAGNPPAGDAAPPNDAGSTNPPAGGEGNPPAKGDTPAGAPESYTDFTAPEGVVLPEPVLDKFKGVAKKFNLSQEQAQELVNEVGPQIAAQQQDQLKRTVADAQAQWEKESRADKEFGGDKLDNNLVVAQKALDAYGTPELKSLLKQSGLGNHPEVIRFCFRAGQSIKEDSHTGGNPPAQEKSTAQILFGGK